MDLVIVGRHSTSCAIGVGIEVASVEVLGGKPSGGTSGTAENIYFITVGSALVEDLLPL